MAAAIAFLVAAADALILAAHPRVALAAVRMTLAEDDVAAQLPCLQSETGCELDTFDNLLAEMKAELEQLENREDQVKGIFVQSLTEGLSTLLPSVTAEAPVPMP